MEENSLDEKYFICTNKKALDLDIICFNCSEVCPFCKEVSQEEYEKFWKNYFNE